MTAQIIDGKQIAADMRAEMKNEITRLRQQGVVPGLGVVLVGDDPASTSYVTGKARACEEAGIYSRDIRLPATTQAELLAIVEQMNRDSKIDGILVQLPIPPGLDENKVLLAIDPNKDVDGFHPISVGKMVIGQKTLLPCTPHGIIQMLIRSGVTIEGAHVVIVGRGNVVGKPLANMLVQKSPRGNATVTICHTRTRDLAHHTRQADILIAAAGQPRMITADMVGDGAVVIDVGVNRVPDATKESGFRLIGDVDFDAVREKASMISPVPGGVGPMTITMLIQNTIAAAKMHAGMPA